MDEGINSLENILTALLFFGGLMMAFVFYRRFQNNPPDQPALTGVIAARALSTRRLAVLGLVLFTLYFLAGCSGQFFYEEQVPLIRLIAQFIIYALFGITLALLNRPRINRFGMGKFKLLFLGAAIYLAVIPFLMVITKAYHFLLDLIFSSGIEIQDVAQQVTGDLSWLQIAYILTAILGAPIYEELIFRGILFPWFLKRAGLKAALIVTAVLFGAIHVHLPSFLPLALLSCIQCIAYWRTGSLWTAIGIHMVWNAVSILSLNIAG